MPTKLHRSIKQPIREGLSMDERWHGPDAGLIWCWERGRQKRLEDPQLADRASKGELVVLAWSGGVEKKSKGEKRGPLSYLATWLGLRGEDLDIDLDEDRQIVCSATGQAVIFTPRYLPSKD